MQEKGKPNPNASCGHVAATERRGCRSCAANRRKGSIHHAPTGESSACGLALPTMTTDNPMHVTCKRCVRAMMPYARQAWAEANGLYL
jgi:hypothetical protein